MDTCVLKFILFLTTKDPCEYIAEIQKNISAYATKFCRNSNLHKTHKRIIKGY